MTAKTPSPPEKTLWAYAYQIVPPQPEHRLASIRALLDREHTSAKAGSHTWEGRLVLEQQVTHILVVSDSLEHGQASSQRLEAALGGLHAGFVITAPLAIVGPPDAPPSGAA